MKRAFASTRSAQAGFSMVELLIAIAIILFGVTLVAQLVPKAIQTNTANRYDSTALILAQRQLELMTAADIRAGTPAPGPEHYYICVAPGDLNPQPQLAACPDLTPGPVAVYRLGQTNAAPLDATPKEAGANLLAGNLEIDWSQNFAGITPGYKNRITLSETGIGGGGPGAQGLGGAQYESRWHVLTIFADFNGFVRPVAKRITISVRGGPPGAVQRPATLTTWVAWRED